MLAPNLPAIKAVGGFIISTSAGKVVGEIVKSNIDPTTLSLLGRTQVRIGTFSLGALVGGMAWRETEPIVEATVNAIDKIQEARNKAAQES